MLRIRSWNKWQGAQGNAVKRNRKKKNHNLDAPYSMQTVSVCTQLERDGNFRSFAKLVGPRYALTFFARVIMYAGLVNGLKGCIDISRSEFGRWVLSTPDDHVGKKLGEKVYDALLLAGLAVEVGPGSSPASEPGSRPGQGGGHCIDKWSEEKRPDPGPSDAESGASRGSATASPDGPASPRSGMESLRDVAQRLGIADKASKAKGVA